MDKNYKQTLGRKVKYKWLLKIQKVGAGEMADWLGMCTVLAEDTRSVPSTCIVAQNCQELKSCLHFDGCEETDVHMHKWWEESGCDLREAHVCSPAAPLLGDEAFLVKARVENYMVISGEVLHEEVYT